MLLDVLQERRVPVFGIGKIHDIYKAAASRDYVTTKMQCRRHGKNLHSCHARAPTG